MNLGGVGDISAGAQSRLVRGDGLFPAALLLQAAAGQ